MRSFLDEACLHRACEVLTQELDRGVDQADIALLDRMAQVYGLDTDARSGGLEERLWANASLLQTALADVTDDGLDRGLHVLGDVAGRSCDVETLHPVLERGVNPFAMHAVETALVLGSGLRSMSATTVDGTDPSLSMHLCLVPRFSSPTGYPWDHASIEISPSIWWDGRELDVPCGTLPQTVLAVATGRWLGDIIRQPALDLLGLRISSIEQRNSVVTLLTDREVAPITWREARDAMKGKTA